MIRICEPVLGDKELEYVTDCLKTGWISSRGKYVSEFEQRFAQYCGCKYGVSTTSGTTALHLAVASLGIGPGDEVIIPAFTMIATAFAVIYTGAKPVLVDVDPETWNMDANYIEEKITKRTRAIMVVHIYGHPCDMDEIVGIAKKHGLYIVEDAAEAHSAEYKGRKTGGLGDVGCFSFYANKIITSGEGGMIVTNHKDIAAKASRLKDLAFAILEERTYLHSELGFNYRMTNVQAAIGLAQFEKIDEYAEMRRHNAHYYNSQLKEISGITLPPEKEWAKSVYWLYSILIEDQFGMDRDKLANKLLQREVETRKFFISMHRQPVFLKMGLFKGESYPVSDELSRKGLHLPSSSGLKEAEIEYISQVINDIRSTGQ
jgi:perosamine synthetase